MAAVAEQAEEDKGTKRRSEVENQRRIVVWAVDALAKLLVKVAGGGTTRRVAMLAERTHVTGDAVPLALLPCARASSARGACRATDTVRDNTRVW